MRKALATGLAVVTLGGAIATATLPSVATAQHYRGGYGGYYGGNHNHHNDWGPAIVAGVAGLAIGAALGSSHSNYGGGYYGRGYYGGYPAYGSGYYGRGYGYGSGYYGGGGGYGYSTCSSQRWVWDPYIGRQVLITTNYAC